MGYQLCFPDNSGVVGTDDITAIVKNDETTIAPAAAEQIEGPAAAEHDNYNYDY